MLFACYMDVHSRRPRNAQHTTPMTARYSAFDYAKIKDIDEAAEVAISFFGKSCPLENIAFGTKHPEVATRLKPIEEAYKRFESVHVVIKAWNSGTWMYLLGFRRPKGPLAGKVIGRNLGDAIERLGTPDAIRCMGYLLDVKVDGETLLDVWENIRRAEFVSDFESGLMNVHRPEDITGSGSDGLDPDGRVRLFGYFGISEYHHSRNGELCRRLEAIRRLQPKT